MHDMCEVSTLTGGVGTVATDVVDNWEECLGADIGVEHFAVFLRAFHAGKNLVAVSQTFDKIAQVHVSFKSEKIKTIKDMEDKRICVWPYGNEASLHYAFDKNGVAWDSDISDSDPDGSQTTVIKQAFNMNEFLLNKCDAASAMRYNELSQVLLETNTLGKLYQEADLNFIDYNEEKNGPGSLEDMLFVHRKWLNITTNQDI
jgi:ABC-type nitrate/sulfonate/bicarbonate transport system substrate-binding protein